MCGQQLISRVSRILIYVECDTPADGGPGPTGPNVRFCSFAPTRPNTKLQSLMTQNGYDDAHVAPTDPLAKNWVTAVANAWNGTGPAAVAYANNIWTVEYPWAYKNYFGKQICQN